MSRTWLVVLMATVVLFALSCNGAGVLLDSPRNVSDVTFGSSWNAHCASYNFDNNVTVNCRTTLGSMYNGTHFSSDIALMDIAISSDLGTPSGLEGAKQDALYIYYDDTGDGYDEE